MEANIDDYKKEIHFIVDKINDLSRIMRLFSFVQKIYKIEMEERKEG